MSLRLGDTLISGYSAGSSYQTITGSTTLDSALGNYVRGNIASAVTTTLPSAADNSGLELTFKHTNASNARWSISRSGSDTIEGGTAAFEIRNKGDVLTLKAIGTDWEIVRFETTEVIKTKVTNTYGKTTNLDTWTEVNAAYRITLKPGLWEVEYNVLTNSNYPTAGEAFKSMGVYVTLNTSATPHSDLLSADWLQVKVHSTPSDNTHSRHIQSKKAILTITTDTIYSLYYKRWGSATGVSILNSSPGIILARRLK